MLFVMKAILVISLLFCAVESIIIVIIIFLNLISYLIEIKQSYNDTPL